VLTRPIPRSTQVSATAQEEPLSMWR
jgi:hypothetical protein